MSINAISSVSLYEQYYLINRQNSQKKNSPIANELKKYGLTPTDNDEYNVLLLQQVKALQDNQKTHESKSKPYNERPWADLMYQLNIPFNENPRDDIEDIKDELAKLVRNVSDKELDSEVKDLENYVEKLYLQFEQNTTNTLDLGSLISGQLNNIATINKASLL